MPRKKKIEELNEAVIQPEVSELNTMLSANNITESAIAEMKKEVESTSIITRGDYEAADKVRIKIKNTRIVAQKLFDGAIKPLYKAWKDAKDTENDIIGRIEVIEDEIAAKQKEFDNQQKEKARKEEEVKAFKRQQRMNRYISIGLVPDLDAVLNWSDDDFELELSSLEKEKAEKDFLEEQAKAKEMLEHEALLKRAEMLELEIQKLKGMDLKAASPIIGPPAPLKKGNETTITNQVEAEFNAFEEETIFPSKTFQEKKDELNKVAAKVIDSIDGNDSEADRINIEQYIEGWDRQPLSKIIESEQFKPVAKMIDSYLKQLHVKVTGELRKL